MWTLCFSSCSLWLLRLLVFLVICSPARLEKREYWHVLTCLRVKIIRPPKFRRFMLMSFLAFLGVEGRMTEVLRADWSLVGRMLVQAAFSNLIQATPAKYEGGWYGTLNRYLPEKLFLFLDTVSMRFRFILAENWYKSTLSFCKDQRWCERIFRLGW